jgi:hypothetical protein
MNRRFEFKLFADYYQFYLQDENTGGDLSESWTTEAVDRLLAIAPQTIGVGTVRNMDVPVIVEIVDAAPDVDTSDWDQVNECSIDIPSGRIVIAGCTDYFPDAARIELSPGPYRARIYYGKLTSLSEDGLVGDDHYKLILWSAAAAPTRVIKQRAKPDPSSS